jgi:class 3 adenylate cyclase
MKKHENGYHIYININNLAGILKNDEKKNDDLAKTFHQLNTFISATEQFVDCINQKTGEEIYVEKLTGARIHLVFESKKISGNAYEVALSLVGFSSLLADHLSNQIVKYTSLERYQLTSGVDYGSFVSFEFVDKDTSIIEGTSIGFPANNAAKLQSVADIGYLLSTQNAFDTVSLIEKRGFSELSPSKNIELDRRYKAFIGKKVYSISIASLGAICKRLFPSEVESTLQYASVIAMATNFNEVKFSDATSKIDYSTLSLKNSKEVETCVFYSDIRGFSKKFLPNGANLDQMDQITTKVLKTMYSSIRAKNGIHVQFQGDRESAIFHHFRDLAGDYIVNSVHSGMILIDKIVELNTDTGFQNFMGVDRVTVGIGISFGTAYCTRLGKKGQKDNIAMGMTVLDADRLEDVYAYENEIAISGPIYRHLIDFCGESIQRDVYLSIFTKRDDVYVTKTGLVSFKALVQQKYEDENAKTAKANNNLHPWG